MKKFISIIFALVMILSMTACSNSNSNIVDQNPTTQVIPQEDHIIPNEDEQEIQQNPNLDKYIEAFNNFELRSWDMSKIYDNFTNDAAVATVYSWNDIPGVRLFVTTKEYNDTKFHYGIMANEDYSRQAVVWLIFENYDEEAIRQFLDEVNFTEEAIGQDNSKSYYCPSGVVATHDGFITVNGSNHYSTMLGKDTSNPKIEFMNYASMEYLLGIEFNGNKESVTITTLWDYRDALDEAVFYGVRGYDEYLEVNGFGVIIDNYIDLKNALVKIDDGPLAEVNYLAAYGYSDPGDDYNDDYTDDYSDWYVPDYDFNKEPESMSDFIEGFEAINDFLIGNFDKLIDVVSGTYGN